MGMTSNWEHAVIIDVASGKVWAGTSRSEKSVAFPDDIVKSFQDERNQLVVHHNHPKVAPLSDDDLRLMLFSPGIKSIVSYGANTERPLEAGKSFSAASFTEEAKKKRAATLGIIEALYDQLDSPTLSALWELYNDGKASEEEVLVAWLEINHKLLHRAGIINYASTYDDSGLAEWGPYQKAVEAAEKVVSDELKEITKTAEWKLLPRDDRPTKRIWRGPQGMDEVFDARGNVRVPEGDQASQEGDLLDQEETEGETVTKYSRPLP